MAIPVTKFLTNDALTRKKWAKDLFAVMLPEIEYSYLVGNTADSIVQLRTELGKGEGDKLTVGIVYPIEGDPVIGDDLVEGTESDLVFKDFSFLVDEVNKAVDTGGKMEEQRVPYDLMTIGKNALSDWWAGFLSTGLMAHLCGDTTYSPGGTIGQDPEAPDSDHHLKVNDVAEASQTVADMLDLHFLDRMKQRAENPTNANGLKVRPIRIKGKKYYRVILHNYVFDQLRHNTNIAQWGDLKRNADKLQEPDVEIEYNGMLITKSERIRALTTNVYRNLFLGAQSAVIGFGGAGDSKGTVMSFVPYAKDANRFMMVRGGAIMGIKKVSFYSQNYGCIVGSSYATALS